MKAKRSRRETLADEFSDMFIMPDVGLLYEPIGGVNLAADPFEEVMLDIAETNLAGRAELNDVAFISGSSMPVNRDALRTIYRASREIRHVFISHALRQAEEVRGLLRRDSEHRVAPNDEPAIAGQSSPQ